MKNRIWVVTIFAVVFALLLGVLGCTQPTPTPTPTPTTTPKPTPTPTAAPIKIKVGGYGPAGYLPRQYKEHWMQLIKDSSKGQIEFEFYPDESLFKLNETWKNVASGAIQAAATYAFSDWGILADISAYPGSWDWNKFNRHYKDPGGFYDWVEPLYEKTNVKLISWSAHGGYELIFKKPVKTKSDLKGLLVRTSTKASGDAMKLLGAEPVSIQTSELYTAIQKGTCDGANQTLDLMKTYKLYEVAPYVVTNRGVLGAGHVDFIMNLDFWKKLPKELQQIMDKATADTDVWYADVVAKQVEATTKDLAAMPGVQVYDLPDSERAVWFAALKPMDEDYLKKWGDQWTQFTKVKEYLR